MLYTNARSIRQLRMQLVDIGRLIDGPHLLSESKVSAWTPAEHLDHILKVGVAMINRLLRNDIERLPAGISPLGRLILTFGRIPRGKGNAPERLRGMRATPDELRASVDKMQSQLAILDHTHLARSRGAIVPHPRFGGLTPAQTLRFAAIHNDHHLRIIDDVLRRG